MFAKGHGAGATHVAALIAMIALNLGIAGMAGGQDRGLNIVARQMTGNPDFDAGKQYAVIIGIDRYKEWPNLRSAVSEAKAVRQALADRYVIDKFFELYDEDATAANIRRLFIETLPAQVGIKDSLLVFYAGHGQTDATKTGFWIASDGSKDQFSQNNWIPNLQIRNMIGGFKAQRILILADACFSGDFLNVTRGSSPTIDNAYYKKALTLVARQVLTSGASESVPDDSEFGHQLVDLLERNDAALIDPVTMYERLRLGVSKTLPLLGTMPGNQEGSSYVLFLKGGTVTRSGSMDAVSGSGDLMVKADQNGAEVLVDGLSYGAAPVLVKKLEAGRSHGVVARTATMSASLDLSLAPGDIKEVKLSLQAFTGNLIINTTGADPGSSHLFVDGVDKGPLGAGIFKGLAVGQRKLELKGQDLYGSASVSISPNDTSQVSAVLRPVETVTIDAPAEAPITLSGLDWKIERPGPRAPTSLRTPSRLQREAHL
jgi:hypothetical protein